MSPKNVYELIQERLEVIFKEFDNWKIQCKLPPKTKRFCPLVLK